MMAACLVSGTAAGLVHFNLLWHMSRRVGASMPGGSLLASVLGRFAMTGCVLALASREGAAPMMAAMLGFQISRFGITRHVRRSLP